jgi:hypothetical protein
MVELDDMAGELSLISDGSIGELGSQPHLSNLLYRHLVDELRADLCGIQVVVFNGGTLNCFVGV